MGFSRQEYWSGLPCPPSGDLPNPGIEPATLTLRALAPPGRLRMCVFVLRRVQLFATPWTVARQAPLSKGFSRQEYSCGIPFPEDLPGPGIEPESPVRQADSLPSELPGKPDRLPSK